MSNIHSAGMDQPRSTERTAAGERASRYAEGIEQSAEHLAEQGREIGEQVQEVAGQARSAVQRSVREQPLATLAVVAAVSFVVGALWKT
ncbi:MAG: hypothetical protein R3D33_09285 [Hyphomicrobiaceae bacterium]